MHTTAGRMVVIVALACLLASPAEAGEPEFLSDGLHSVTISTAPIRPVLSSYRWSRGLDWFSGEEGKTRLSVDVWTLTDTWYLLPIPLFAFFELGASLGYYPIVSETAALRVGAGAAVEMVGMSLAVPFYATVEWRQLLFDPLWVGTQLEGFAWSNGIGLELSIPLLLFPDFWLFGGIRPTGVVYIVEEQMHLNYRIGFELGYRRRRP